MSARVAASAAACFGLALLGACADPDEARPLDGSDELGDSDEFGDSGGSEGGPLPDLGAGTDEGETGEPPLDEPPLYPGGRVHSPITPAVVAALSSIRAAAPGADDALFIKLGASSTVSPQTLYCFAEGPLDLDVHEPALGPTLDHFLAGETAEGTTAFDRDTLAALSGKTAGWAITGEPSPLEQELAAISPAGPSLALIHYGANDMQQGISYASALPGYYANMSALLDQLLAAGVVPIVFGLSRRLDQPAADLWVQSYNATARALAQARRVPFVDLREALEDLDGYGLSDDGLHLEGYAGGACILTPAGLEHGYNVRNLIALESLTRVRRALADGDWPEADLAAPTLLGTGSSADPFDIPALPFADSRDSADGPGLTLDSYTGCAATADESGPEHLYRLELTAPTALRAIVLDQSGVDVDLHLLDQSASEAGCLQRDDTLIETTLEPGVYHFALDTYVDGEGVEQSGDYTFVLLECEPGDPACQL